MRALWSLGLASIAGCAATAMPTSEMKPPMAVLQPALLTPAAGVGALIVKRDINGGPPACIARISIDGKPAVDLAGGQGVMLYLSAGARIVSMTVPTFGCPDVDSELSTNIVASGKTAMRVNFGPDGRFKLMHTASIE